ncbi:MAG TPA: hypothetical protein VJ850_10615 [Candidatus Limnocylindrales bacterium]|nr:hypothetical protein [Candidatus Limnocylindrales bacterium]
MEERMVSMPGEAPPVAHADANVSTGSLTDPGVLQILSTEHWSLLAARSLVYNEAFSRAGMYLSFLSATVVALGLIATATGFTDGFLMITTVLLAIDLFIGYASLGRIASTSSEDIKFLQGMNRIRNAYVQIAPAVAPYFLHGHHDDPTTVLGVYGPVEATTVSSMLHGFTTVPGMIGAINSAVAGALVAVLTMLATHNPLLAGILGIVVFLTSFIGLTVVTMRMIRRFWASFEVRFPKG